MESIERTRGIKKRGNMAVVSIIIPYNKDRGYLNEAIKSVQDQTYTDFELILSHSNAPVSTNCNKGIKKATGDLITFLSEDDLLTPYSIENRVNGMGTFDFIHSKGMYYPYLKEYGLTNPNITFESCLENNGIMGGSTMYRAEMLKENLFDESLETAEEWELHLRLLTKGYKLGFIDKFTYLYRRHNKQKSIGNLSHEYQQKRQQTKDLIRRRYL